MDKDTKGPLKIFWRMEKVSKYFQMGIFLKENTGMVSHLVWESTNGKTRYTTKGNSSKGTGMEKVK